MDDLIKLAPLDPPVLDVVRRRWSPRTFSDRPVSEDDLRACLSAAQWAASTYNEQEWRYVVARREDRKRFSKALACLVPKNQQWAKLAPVLMFSIGRPTFSRNGKPNPVWQHDVGLASGQLVLQATALGLYAHQMAGIEHELIRKTYKIPPEFEPVAGIAIGYIGRADDLPEDFRAAEVEPRTRRPLSETVFSDEWGHPGLIAEASGG
ncbi:MAG: nitroreductase family protein [Phycisphaerae bacterium]|nr:nitroreductase family protein [Phycisphaerae bacterium]